MIIGNPKKLVEGAETAGDQTFQSNGAMPHTQGMQPIQQTTMYSNPAYPQQAMHSSGPNGAPPMGQVQQHGAPFNAAPAYGGQHAPSGFGQPPNPASGFGNAPQQFPQGTYQSGPYGQPQQQMVLRGGYGAPQYQNSPAPGFSANQVLFFTLCPRVSPVVCCIHGDTQRGRCLLTNLLWQAYARPVMYPPVSYTHLTLPTICSV